MRKILKVVGGIILFAVVLLVALLIFLSKRPFVPSNYTNTVKAGGEIEAKYLATGSNEVKYIEESADDRIKKYEIYYPAELESRSERYPAVVFVNGSGVIGSRYKALFKHLASWGFIVVGNEDESTGDGVSVDQTLMHLIALNEDTDSIFWRKIDTNNIGISGHSQGGAGALRAITVNEHSVAWKAGVALSPTQEELANALGWTYDLEKVNIPLLMLAGTEGDFETQTVIPFESMKAMFNKINAPKAMARRIGAEHGDMLFSADGYVTAWFMWQLKGDSEAAKAFTGHEAELLSNTLYQDQQAEIY